jgi:hypothetical protein
VNNWRVKTVKIIDPLGLLPEDKIKKKKNSTFAKNNSSENRRQYEKCRSSHTPHPVPYVTASFDPALHLQLACV